MNIVLWEEKIVSLKDDLAEKYAAFVGPLDTQYLEIALSEDGLGVKSDTKTLETHLENIVNEEIKVSQQAESVLNKMAADGVIS